MDTPSPPPQRKVLVAGGGFAAVEALLALRALLGERVELTLISSGERLAFRPAATYEAFDSNGDPPNSCSLREITADAQARFHHGRLESVSPAVHAVRLASGASLRYDSLILALGARARVAIPGALTFRDQRDVPQMRALLEEVRRGAARRIVFAVPSGCAWPMPLYELAMFTAAYAEQADVEVEVSLVSPAGAPLDIFGAQASARVQRLLMERGVRFRGGLVPAGVRYDGALQLHFGGTVPADRVVAAPQLRGPRIVGVPSRWWGFVPTDPEGRVEDLIDVYAAGDMTSFPIKQGGLAAQQADMIARVIAAQEGIDVAVPPPVDHGRMIEAQLLGGVQTLAMKARLDAHGAHDPSFGCASATPLRQTGSAQGKISGRYLRSYLAGRGIAARRGLRAEKRGPAEDAHAANGV
ncbi:MAG: FAD-dependent oxidoreductase [Solirubrobacteraceae bacterium]